MSNEILNQPESSFDLMTLYAEPDGSQDVSIARDFSFFTNQIEQLRLRNSGEYSQFVGHIDGLKNELREIVQAEINLIKRHIQAGERLVMLQEWFKRNFETTDGWEDFVISQVDYEYSTRTAARDMRVWRRLASYKDVLISAGTRPRNAKLAISTVYLLSNPNVMSEEAVEWCMSLIQDHVDIAAVGTDSAQVYGRLTYNQAKAIAETTKAIEKDVPDDKKDAIKRIARDNHVTSPAVIRELAKQDAEFLQEVQQTGHIEYLVEQEGGGIEQRNIPIGQAGVTDFHFHHKAILSERAVRHKQHRQMGALDKERREKGTESVFFSMAEAGVLDEGQKERLTAFLYDNPDIKQKMGSLLGMILQAQGDAGLRASIYRVNYVQDNELSNNKEVVVSEEVLLDNGSEINHVN